MYDSEESFLDDEDEEEMAAFINDNSQSDQNSDGSDPAWSNKRKTRGQRGDSKEKKADR